MVFVDKCYFVSVWFDVVSDAERLLIASLSNKTKCGKTKISFALPHYIYVCVMCELLVRNGPVRRDSCP